MRIQSTIGYTYPGIKIKRIVSRKPAVQLGEPRRERMNTKNQKPKSTWTDKMVAEMRKNAPLNLEKCAVLAQKFGKPTRSVIAKTVTAKISYIRKPRNLRKQGDKWRKRMTSIDDYIKNHPSNFEKDIIEGISETYKITVFKAIQHYNNFKKQEGTDEYNWYGDVS